MQLTGSLPSVSAALRYTEGLGLNRGGSKSLSPLCTLFVRSVSSFERAARDGRWVIHSTMRTESVGSANIGRNIAPGKGTVDGALTKSSTTTATANGVDDEIINEEEQRQVSGPHTLSAGKYSSSLQAVMDAGTLGLGLVVEMQNATPAAVRAASTWCIHR